MPARVRAAAVQSSSRSCTSARPSRTAVTCSSKDTTRGATFASMLRGRPHNPSSELRSRGPGRGCSLCVFRSKPPAPEPQACEQATSIAALAWCTDPCSHVRRDLARMSAAHSQ